MLDNSLCVHFLCQGSKWLDYEFIEPTQDFNEFIITKNENTAYIRNNLVKFSHCDKFYNLTSEDTITNIVNIEKVLNSNWSHVNTGFFKEI